MRVGGRWGGEGVPGPDGVLLKRGGVGWGGGSGTQKAKSFVNFCRISFFHTMKSESEGGGG